MKRRISWGPALLGVTLLALTLVGTAFAWEPSTFEPFCGRAEAREATDLPWSDVSNAWYADQFFDPDAESPCWASETVQSWLSTALTGGLGYLEALGFTASPSPVRLGPVFDGVLSDPVVRYYLVDPGAERAGAASTLVCRADTNTSDVLAIMYYFPKSGQHGRAGAEYVATHELVHVVQGAQPLFASRPCFWLPQWFSEGVADHLATERMRGDPRYANLRPSAAQSIGRNLLGLRRYDVPLTDEDDGLNPYRTSSLLRYVTERWHDGDERRWADAMARPARQSDPMRWFDDLLRSDDFGVGQPLALVYPAFLTSYAGWGDPDSDRWPHVGTSTWRDHAFSGCDVVAVAPDAPQTLELRLPLYAGACVEVQTTGVPPGRVASVEVGIQGDTLEAVDDLHLGGVSLGLDPVGGGPATCIAYERIAPPAVPACVFQPVTASREIGSGIVEWARSWPLPQVQSDGQGWSTELVFTRAPDVPPPQSRPDRTYTVTFAVKTARADTGEREMQDVSAGTNFSQDDATGLPTDPGVTTDPAAMVTDPVGFATRPRGGPTDLPLGPNVAPGPGMFTLGFSEADEDGNGAAFRFLFDQETLRRDGQATVPAQIVGAGPRGQVVDASPEGQLLGRVAVLAWDDDRLHVRATGEWCWFDEFDPIRGCRETRTFEGEAWFGFGGAHDASQPFTEQDSPVQELYREAVRRAYGSGGGIPIPLPGPPGPPPPDAPPGEAGDGSASSDAFECDCSCETFARIEEMGEAMDSGEMQPDPAVVQAVTSCMMQCVMQFGTCEE